MKKKSHVSNLDAFNNIKLGTIILIFIITWIKDPATFTRNLDKIILVTFIPGFLCLYYIITQTPGKRFWIYPVSLLSLLYLGINSLYLYLWITQNRPMDASIILTFSLILFLLLLIIGIALQNKEFVDALFTLYFFALVIFLVLGYSILYRLWESWSKIL